MKRDEMLERIAQIEQAAENLDLKKSLKLRFFSPAEVARLMSFPTDFTFPNSVNEKQQYKLLGNSVNVAVVSELIKLLVPFVA